MKAFFFLMVSLIFVGCRTASFTDLYKEQNRGKFIVEIPEVMELVHIAIAITPSGLTDSNMVDQTTGYYQEVMNYFKPFMEEPLIKELEKRLPDRYAHVKMDACGYYFNTGNELIKSKDYDQLNWTSTNYIDPLLDELQEFAIKTNFRTFYSTHKEYYRQQIELLENQSPVKKQWDWLEQRFPQRYDNYWITFSTLVGGSHSTNRFVSNDFKQTVMFVQGGISSNSYSEKVKEGLMTRVVFTEIDHNYVDPISKKYASDIKAIFKNRNNWTITGSSADDYSSELAIFNEYMTWAVFLLYASDQFDSTNFDIINEKIEAQMKNDRGFKEFSSYNRELLLLYKSDKYSQIEELYPSILKWCRTTIANK